MSLIRGQRGMIVVYPRFRGRTMSLRKLSKKFKLLRKKILIIHSEVTTESFLQIYQRKNNLPQIE